MKNLEYRTDYEPQSGRFLPQNQLRQNGSQCRSSNTSKSRHIICKEVSKRSVEDSPPTKEEIKRIKLHNERTHKNNGNGKAATTEKKPKPFQFRSRLWHEPQCESELDHPYADRMCYDSVQKTSNSPPPPLPTQNGNRHGLIPGPSKSYS